MYVHAYYARSVKGMYNYYSVVHVYGGSMGQHEHEGM